MASIDTIILRIHKINSTHAILGSIIQKKKKIYSQEILKSKIEDSKYERILKQGSKQGTEKTTFNGRVRLQKELKKHWSDIKHSASAENYNPEKYKSVFNDEEIELIKNSDNVKECILYLIEQKREQLTEEEIFSSFIDILNTYDKKEEVVTIRKYYKQNKETIVPNSLFGKISSNSHHYEIRFKLDWINDYLELEFSIPKALYGTNVFQNIYHLQTHAFREQSKLSDINFQSNFVINNLNKQLKEIFFSYFHIEFDSLDKRQIELTRIDICYNQVFKTKDTALTYLSQQKHVAKKWERSDMVTPRHTSVSWTSNGNSFKIYHKGSEFEKHDRKKLIQINKKRVSEKLPLVDIDKIHELANRTLRYEMTYRAKRLSDLYKRKFHFKFNFVNTPEQDELNHVYQQLKKDVNRWKYLYDKHSGGRNKYELEDSQIKKKSIYEIRLGKKVLVRKDPILSASYIEYKKILDDQHKRNKLISYSKWFDKVAKCLLDNDLDFEINNENIEKRFSLKGYQHEHKQMFDHYVLTKDFFKVIVSDFWSLVDQFKLKYLEDETKFIAKVEDRNQSIQRNLDIDKLREKRKQTPLKRQYHERHKYNVGTMKLLYFLIREKGFKEVEKEKMFPDSTWKRHKARLKELGITPQSTHVFKEEPRFDHYRYHQYLYYNSHLIRNQLKGYRYLKS